MSWRNSKNWFKALVLQGPENDYGDYDYLIEELPQDYAKWEFDRKYAWKCDTCGKDSHLLFRSEHFFYCWDGWDSMSSSECWKCRLKGNIRHYKWKIKHAIKIRIRAFKEAKELYKLSKHVKPFKHWYQLALNIEKK